MIELGIFLSKMTMILCLSKFINVGSDVIITRLKAKMAEDGIDVDNVDINALIQKSKNN